MKIRLHQFLSKCGEFSSKREVKEAIWNGEIQINDSIVKDMKFEFNTNTKIVYYQGRILKLPEKNQYFLLNKPKGYICSRLNSQERGFGKKSIFELFEKTLSKNIYRSLVTVGRLDEDTTGLLLVTNDGKIVDKITNPKGQVSKTYYVETEFDITKQEIAAIRDGIPIKIEEEEYISRPAKISLQDLNIAILTINEGKKRQIRRMFDTLGNYVVSIHRMAIGDLELDDYRLEEGDFVEVQQEEIIQKCF